MNLISRKDAQNQGLNYYYTGIPCKYNHVAKRQVCNGTCYECVLTRNKTYQEKNKDKFKTYKADWHLKNKEHVKLYGKNYRKKNSEQIKAKNENYRLKQRQRIKDWHLQSTYGITRQEYLDLANSNNNTCFICNQPETEVDSQKNLKPLVVDHCHTTNTVRGLLCNSCNRGLGQFNDSIDKLTLAIAYLSKFN